jgi:hypothetical protein
MKKEPNIAEPRVYRRDVELDRRCEAIASVVRELRDFAPVHFYEVDGLNGTARYTLQTKKV